MKWYLLYKGEKVGPLTKEKMLIYNPTPDTKVWKEGMEDWQAIYTIPELLEFLEQNRPEETLPQPTPPVSGKSYVVAGILAILLGHLGIQYFYIGKTKAGVITLLVDIFCCGGLGLLWLASLVQGIMILVMGQEKFDEKFVNSDNDFPLF